VEVLEADLADVAATMTSKLLVVKAVTEAAIHPAEAMASAARAMEVVPDNGAALLNMEEAMLSNLNILSKAAAAMAHPRVAISRTLRTIRISNSHSSQAPPVVNGSSKLVTKPWLDDTPLDVLP